MVEYILSDRIFGEKFTQRVPHPKERCRLLSEANLSSAAVCLKIITIKMEIYKHSCGRFLLRVSHEKVWRRVGSGTPTFGCPWN